MSATIAIMALSVSVWAHHYVRHRRRAVLALMTMLIAVPTGVKIFNWIGFAMWRGSITFETPMVFSLGTTRLVRLRWPHRRHPRPSPPLGFALLSDSYTSSSRTSTTSFSARSCSRCSPASLLVAEVDGSDAQR